MSSENVTRLQGWYEAFGRGDMPTVLAAMDPNIEWNEPQAPGLPFSGVHRGPQAVANEVFGTVPTSLEEFAVVPHEFIDAGDRVIVLGEFRGKGKARGTPFVAPFVHVFTFRDGKVTRLQNYTDTGRGNKVRNGLSCRFSLYSQGASTRGCFSKLQQLGALPTPGQARESPLSPLPCERRAPRWGGCWSGVNTNFQRVVFTTIILVNVFPPALACQAI